VKYGLGKIDCGSKVNMLIIENNCLRKFTNLSSLIDMEMLNLVDLRELLACQYPVVMCCCTKAYVYRLKNKNKKRKSALRFHPILPVRLAKAMNNRVCHFSKSAKTHAFLFFICVNRGFTQIIDFCLSSLFVEFHLNFSNKF